MATIFTSEPLDALTDHGFADDRSVFRFGFQNSFQMGVSPFCHPRHAGAAGKSGSTGGGAL